MPDLTKQELSRHTCCLTLLSAMSDMAKDAIAFHNEPFSPRRRKILADTLVTAQKTHRMVEQVLREMVERDEPPEATQ